MPRKNIVVGTSVYLRTHPYRGKGHNSFHELAVLICKETKKQMDLLIEDGATPISHSAFVYEDTLYITVTGIKK